MPLGMILLVAVLGTAQQPQTQPQEQLPCGPNLYQTGDVCIKYGSRLDTPQNRQRAKQQFPQQSVKPWPEPDKSSKDGGGGQSQTPDKILTRTYHADGFSFGYPESWQVQVNNGSVTIAPDSAHTKTKSGQSWLTEGLLAGTVQSHSSGRPEEAANALFESFRKTNPYAIKVGGPEPVKVGVRGGAVVEFSNPNPDAASPGSGLIVAIGADNGRVPYLVLLCSARATWFPVYRKIIQNIALDGTAAPTISAVPVAPNVQQSSQSNTSPDDRQVATWEPIFNLDNELYPSFVFSMGGPAFKPPAQPHFYGYPWGLAEVRIRPLVDNARVHVEIKIEGLTQESALDVTLAKAGEQYRIAPLLRYDYSRLARIDQSIPATVTYAVRMNGVDLGQKTVPIRVRSVNDVPFMVVSPHGEQQDLSFLFAGFVNESHPFVETVLQQALHWRAINSFTGYQRGPQEVRLQVFALWNVLQRNQLHYSDITTSSAASPSGHVYSQAVRFIDQSVKTQQANCVDGSVLFASLLYKIGIHPVLVLKPGHMFVGYYLDNGHKQMEFLETTMLGASHQPGAYNLAFSPVLHPVQSSESWKQFLSALNHATQVFTEEVAPAIREHRPKYRMIDVAQARKNGVNSIPH